MMVESSYTAIPLLIFGIIVTRVVGDGMLSIHFNHFTNPQGLGANGHCCDGRAFFCLSPCDHYFILCLDHPDGNPNDYIRCPLGRFVTNKIDEMDSIRFGATIGGVNNPLLVPVRHWRNGFLLKVEIWDSDIGVTAGEYVDSLRKKVIISMAKKASLAETRTVLLSTRTSLTIEVKAFCNPNYYGPQCTTKCINQDDASGHFKCDEDTGERRCLPGWSGEQCTEQINECASSPCLNGGTCVDDHNRFDCSCRKGTVGDRCQVNIDDCQSNPCLNGGTCFDLIGGFSCNCAPGYLGKKCHLPDPCSAKPCKNNGTCVNEGDFEYACDCHAGFTGENCKTSLNPIPVMTNAVNIDADHDSLPLPLLLDGHLKHEDEINLKRWLIDVVTKSTAIKADQFVAVVTLSHCKGEDGDPVTNALLKVTYDIQSVGPNARQKSKTFITNKIEDNFPYKKYSGGDCMIAQIAALVVEDSWISRHWFIPVGVAMAVAAIIVIILIIFVKRLRRKNAHDRSVAYECVETSSSAATTPRHSTSSSPDYDVTNAFSNAIYLQNDRQPLRNGVLKYLPEMSAEEEKAIGPEGPYDDYQEENIYHTID